MAETNNNARRFEPRCKVCTHRDRSEIDLVLARQKPYVRIGETFDLPYRSLANHARKHLNRDEPAIRAAMEEELAVAARIHQLGVRYEIERRLLLDLAIKTYLDLLSSEKVGLGKM
jgi:hypothetical protein